MEFNNNAMIYAFNNAVIQQVGVDNEPFGEERINKTIMQIAPLPFEQQKEALNNILDQWLGNVNQTGDIAIIAIKCDIW